MVTSAKRERFEKVASARVQKIIDMLALLKNCANTNNYEYGDEDVELMFNEINKALKDARSAYSTVKNKEMRRSFTFNKKQ